VWAQSDYNTTTNQKKKLWYQWCSRITFNRLRLSENSIHTDNNTRFKIGGEIGTREIHSK
jgi:hypothetical protein